MPGQAGSATSCNSVAERHSVIRESCPISDSATSADRRDRTISATDADGVPVAQDVAVAQGEDFREMPFLYADGTFPAELGVVVMKTVLDGSEPARIVTHWADGD
jgi:hypothetical protein